jgi:alpha-L-rhamnosidase
MLRPRFGALLLLVVSFARSASGAEPPGLLKPTNLRCEYLVDPRTVDVSHPRLSWELKADGAARNVSQVAYQIVASKPPDLIAGKDVLWDSGRIASSQTCQIEYQGPQPQSRNPVAWRVRVWDNKGGVSDWSPPSHWYAGLRRPEDWGGAQWIADVTPAENGVAPLPAPMFRKSFSTADAHSRVVHASLWVSALGLYDLSINGVRVRDRFLAPEWTDYTKRVQYQHYDVTKQMMDGENCIGVILGDGWYAGKIGLAHIVPNGPARAIYGRKPELHLRLDLSFADRTTRTIVSDGSWESTLSGPIVADDILDGETYDARKEILGWSAPGHPAAGVWSKVHVCDPPPCAVVAQPNEPIWVHHTVHAEFIHQPKPGVYVFDMGRNFAGWCRVTFTAKAGTTITLRHAEVQNPDYSIYTDNLRGAAQTDRYTCATDGPETFEPRFTYHGFRYLEVTGLPSKPSLDAVTGCDANSYSRETSTFECSDPMVNQLWENIVRTQMDNLMGVPTDCPQRDERCGWMGDILAFAPTACFNMDMAAFFTKWIPDTRDAQAKDGRFPDFAPHPYDPDARFSGVPAWGDAGVFVPWVAYQYYGDTRILADQFDAAVRWVEYIRGKNPDLLWKNSRGNDYGDWLNADTLKLEGWPKKGAEVPKDVFATMYFFRSTQIVAEMAKVLGRDADAKKYGELADKIRAAFVAAYVKAADGDAPILRGDTQAGYALALHFGLIPEPLQAAATQRMVDRFKPYDGQISTGFHSTLPLMTQLSLRGHNDQAYRLLLNRKMPSWGYEIDHGATTIWERWDGYVEGRGFQDPGMNSFAHYAIGSVGEWLFATMLGIKPDEPGFAKVTIAPHPGPGIDWAKGTYHSIRGPISVAWDQRENQLQVTVTIPPNVAAKVVLPAREVLTMDGHALKPAEADLQGATCSVRVGSGTYEFVVR